MSLTFTKKLHLQLEIPVFLFFFALTFCDPIKSNLLIFRTCYVTLSYDKEECVLLGSQNPDNVTGKLEELVEPFAATVSMMNVLIDGFCSAILCMFVGPWSDRFGRKPVLVAPLIGYFLYYLLLAVFSTLDGLSPWFSLLCLLPLCLSGGLSSYFAAALCYITDSTKDEDRGMKMALLETVFYLGLFLGTISSSYIFAATNYATVFTIGSICCLLGLIFTIYEIPESLTVRETAKFADCIKKFFDLSSISDLVRVSFKERQNYVRYTLLSCFVLTTLSGIVTTGNESVMLLFLRERFHWSLQKITVFAAYAHIFSSLGTLIGVFFLHKLLKFPETVLMLVSLISTLNAVLMLGLARSDWLVYLVPVARLLGGVFGPMLRLLISKMIPKSEVGKVFALLTASQFLFGVLGSPIFTFIYKGTIRTNPGIFNFVSAGMIGFQISVLIGVIVVRTVHSRTYTLVEEEEEIDDQIEGSER